MSIRHESVTALWQMDEVTEASNAGQALPDGLSTRRIPMKGFRFASLHFIPLSQALLGAM